MSTSGAAVAQGGRKLRRMEGSLFKYGGDGAHVAFQSGTPTKGLMVYIGGLTDGLLACQYVPPLAAALQALGWSLVQTLLRSSHSAYGSHSLQTDSEDLDELLPSLDLPERMPLVLMGHSTGCQNCVHYLRYGKHKARVGGIILQAPVSDREFRELDPQLPEQVQLAKELVDSGNASRLLPPHFEHVPITAHRFLSLAHARGEGDDLFSSDLSDAELKATLGHVHVPSLVLYSLLDEYVPDHVDKERLAQRLGKALSSNGSGKSSQATVCMIEGANHAADAPIAREALVSSVCDFVSNFGQSDVPERRRL